MRSNECLEDLICENSYPATFINHLLLDAKISCDTFAILAKAMSCTCGKALTERFLESVMIDKNFSKKDLQRALDELVEKRLAIKFPVPEEDTRDGSKNVYLFFQFPLTDEQFESFFNGKSRKGN